MNMDTPNPTTEEQNTALFAQLVLQQTNMALMLLGRMPHPQTGETTPDLEAAAMFIDQLEMLEAKTKGNLGREEQQLLKQSLMTLRMSFVEASEKPAAAPASDPAATPEATPITQEAGAADTTAAAPAESPQSTPAGETQKKFVKKY